MAGSEFPFQNQRQRYTVHHRSSENHGGKHPITSLLGVETAFFPSPPLPDSYFLILDFLIMSPNVKPVFVTTDNPRTFVLRQTAHIITARSWEKTGSWAPPPLSCATEGLGRRLRSTHGYHMSPVPEGEGHIHLSSSGIITAHGCSQVVVTALFAYFYNVWEDAYSPKSIFILANTRGLGEQE